MSFSRPLILFAFAGLMALVIGCSGNGSPVAPGNDQQTGSLDNAPIIGLTDVGDDFNAIGMLGAYELDLSSESMTAEIVSKRTSTIGESWTLNGLAYFTIAPCADCLEMKSISFVSPYIKLAFTLSHPFPKGNTSLPPTAKNRLDLDVFDVAMVIRPRAGTPNNFTIGSIYGDICASQSGFTAELGDFLQDSTACPYFLVMDDTSTMDLSYNRFEMGTVDAPFDVYFKGGGKFDMYLTFGYGFSAVKKDRLNPMYYNPEFNKKASWKVNVIPPEGTDLPTMANTWNDLDTTTPFTVSVEVYDWQQGANVDPTLVNLTDVYAASNVSKVTVEIPGMTAAPVEVTTASDGNGLFDDPLIFEFDIANENGLGAGEYYSLVKVEDERLPQNPIVDRDHLISSPDGVALENYTLPGYTTYQTFIATVVIGCGPITGTIDEPASSPVTNVYDDQELLFEASASSDNGGDPVILYEWDADYDGTTFDVDATGKSVCLGPFDNPNCGGTNNPFDYTVAVRATDSCTPANRTVFATCIVTVDHCITTTPKVNRTQWLDKISGDTWFDIGVQSNGFVYIVADHPATSNTGGVENTGTRTALQYQNNLTGMQVINSGGTGMSQPGAGTGWGSYEFNRIDVSPANILVTNFAGARVVPWSVSGTVATPGACCFCIWCGLNSFCIDVSDYINAPGYGNGVFCMGQTNDSCTNPVNWAIGFNEIDISTYGGYNWSEGAGRLFEDEAGIKGSQGIPGTLNQVVLYTTATEGYLAIVGDCFTLASNMVLIDDSGPFGAGVECMSFSEGVDVAVDSNGNILALDKQGTDYRFQKFDSSLTFLWTSSWNETYIPMRMDYDKGDNTLYILCQEGIAICTVDP